MSTPVTNFAKATVAAGYTAAVTAISVLTGEGSRFPSTFPFPATWWNATDYPDPTDDPDREIVTVTARTGDDFTVTRGAEGTVASNKNTAGKTYKLLATITAQMWRDLSSQNLSQAFRGLRVYNHPDADQKAQAVMFDADSIVMDDGQEIQDWAGVEADLTVSGVGGIDTGVEAASTTYELYAISDGGTNKKGLLHRAKDYVLDEVYTAGEDGEHALRDATARTKLSQGVRFDVAGPLAFVDVRLRKTGAPSGNVWLTLEADSGGVPSGNALATSSKYSAVLLLTTGTWCRIPFRTPFSVSAATQYHLVLQGDYTVNASNYVAWRADTTAAGYANGAKAAYDGTTWTADADDDFVFSAYVLENDTPVTLPTGYTQKALIQPFVYNDSGGDLLNFMSQDRTIHCHSSQANSISSQDEWAIFAVGSGPTTNTLYHLVAKTPPRPCTAHITFGNTTASISAQFGHITATWLSAPLAAGPGALPGTFAPAAVSDGYAISPERAVFVEYHGLMAITGGGNTFARVNRIEW